MNGRANRLEKDSARNISGDAIFIGLGYLVSFIYPLVTLPLLSRALGADHLGLLMFVFAVLQIVVMVTDYGFTVSASRRVVLARSRDEYGEIVSSTLTAQYALFFGSAIVLLGIAYSVGSMRENISLYWWGLLFVGCGLVFPNWLLQGLGYIRTFALITAVSRIIGLVGFLLTVRSSDDIVWAVMWQFSPPGIAAVIAWSFLWRKGQAYGKFPQVGKVHMALKDGGPLFLSSIAHLLTNNANTVVLGATSSSAQVAYFGASERFGNAGRGVMNGVEEAMLPRMTLARTSAGGRRIQSIIVLGVLGLHFCAGLLLILNAPWFVPWYLGDGFDEAIPLTQVIGLAFCIAGGSTVFRMLASAAHRYIPIGIIAISVGLVQVAILIPASMSYGAMGAALTILVGEIILLGAYFADYCAVRWREKHPGSGAS